MENQVEYYRQKLKWEIDSADLTIAIEGEDKIQIVDARSSEAFLNEHIPGSINIPHNIMSKESINFLDKDTLYITYCDGIGCNASTKGALKLSELGFIVKELIGGIDWWKRDGYETKGKKGIEGKKIECGC